MGFVPVLLINIGGALAGSGMQGQNPNGAIAGAAVGTAIGYPIGVGIEKPLQGVLNPWYRPQWKDLGLGMSTYIPQSPIPSWIGNVFGGIAQEKFGNSAQNKLETKNEH